MQYVWIALAIIFIGVVLLWRYFARIIIYPKVYPYEEVYDIKLEDGEFDPKVWADWHKEEIWVESSYGYKLHGYWLPEAGSKKTVILAHGITVNLFASIKYVLPFKTRGFNVLMYDHRNHGKSGGNVTTFGMTEKVDLKTMVDWVEARVGADGVIGTHGESMGAAIVLQHAAIDPRVKFVVEDCSFINLPAQLRYRIREEFHLRGWVLIPVASLFSKFIGGFFFGEVNPQKDIEKVETPILFIHGAEDDYIPPAHAQSLFDGKSVGLKELWFAPNARHAGSQPNNVEAYYQKVGDFLERVMPQE